METYPLLRKGFAVGVIFLFFSIVIAPGIKANMPIPGDVTSGTCASNFIADLGTLSGYVTDSVMNPIEGARVRVYFHNTSRENYSDANGYFHVTDISICNCTKNATCSKEGYDPAWVYLTIWENTTYDFVLTSKDHWLYVGGSGPGNYTRIQDAINDSSNGDTIFVYKGTYYEHVKADKAIRLIGEEMNSTIIDGGGNGSVVKIAANVTISGFTIQHSGHTFRHDAGITNYHPSELIYTFSVSGNCIKNNKNGVVIQSSQDDSITENTFLNNDIGISLVLTSNCKINHNNFINNTNHSFFDYFFFFQIFPHNDWNENYWDNWHSVLPKPIRGVKELVYLILRPGMIYTIPFPWINFDWHPAQTPYEIEDDMK